MFLQKKKTKKKHIFLLIAGCLGLANHYMCDADHRCGPPCENRLFSAVVDSSAPQESRKTSPQVRRIHTQLKMRPLHGLYVQMARDNGLWCAFFVWDQLCFVGV